MSLIDLGDFKKYMSVTRDFDPADDTLLQSALDSAEEAINAICGRQFVVASTTATTRNYVPPRGEVLRIHDCTSIASIAVAGTAVSSDDVQYEPVDNLAADGSWRPFDQVRRFYGWPCPATPGKATVAVEATWGWETVPSRVYDANRVLAKDVMSNQNLSFGLVATDEVIARARDNPQVMGLLRGLQRAEAVFGIA